MKNILHVSHVCIAIILGFSFLTSCTANLTLVNHYCFNDRGNFTENSTYTNNLVQALSDLYSESTISHFYNTTAGLGQDMVYSLYYCRYDLSLETCQSCIREAILTAVNLCLTQKEVIVWYEECTLRYANRLIFSQEEEDMLAWRKARQDVSGPSQFDQIVEDTLDDLINQAVSGNSTDYFATGEASISSNETLYGLVQCTPDITSLECSKCLKFALNQTESCCSRSIWAMLFLPSCQLRYVLVPFHGTNSTAADPVVSDAPPSPPLESSPPPLNSSPPPLEPSDDQTTSVESPPTTVTEDASPPPPPSPSISTLGSRNGSTRHSGSSCSAIILVVLGLVVSQLM